MASLVLTAIGDDRAGLVRELADVIAAHGGNWEESQMAELAGKFAGIVLVEVPDERVAAFTAALEPLSAVLDVRVDIGRDSAPASTQFTLRLLGNDRPGIVRELAAVVAAHGVSIDRLATTTRPAPMAGGDLFEAEAVLEIPDDVDRGALRAALEDLAGELMVDIDVES